MHLSVLVTHVLHETTSDKGFKTVLCLNPSSPCQLWSKCLTKLIELLRHIVSDTP